jgi:hypothetical protein
VIGGLEVEPLVEQGQIGGFEAGPLRDQRAPLPEGQAVEARDA